MAVKTNAGDLVREVTSGRYLRPEIADAKQAMRNVIREYKTVLGDVGIIAGVRGSGVTAETIFRGGTCKYILGVYQEKEETPYTVSLRSAYRDEEDPSSDWVRKPVDLELTGNPDVDEQLVAAQVRDFIELEVL